MVKFVCCDPLGEYCLLLLLCLVGWLVGWGGFGFGVRVVVWLMGAITTFIVCYYIDGLVWWFCFVLLVCLGLEVLLFWD